MALLTTFFSLLILVVTFGSFLPLQRYGPPPSYPHLKIPGLNAPIPYGAKFGYAHGDWGKPPVDEVGSTLSCLQFLLDLYYLFFTYGFQLVTQYGRPLYGDVFGVSQQEEPNYEVSKHMV